jgi:glycosyltransferase involved in cell wall biosynthesis
MQAEKIKVIYNGVNPDRFSPKSHFDIRNELGIKQDDFLIGFVGQLNERKGVDTLIRAFTLFSKQNKKSALLLTGEGNMEKQCRQMVQNCPGNVIFSGYREDIERVMNTIDVLVLPSLWEGFGIVLIEAMSAGRPVITTTASNMPEIVSQGVEGLLVPPADENGLANAFMELCRNPILARKMGEAGRRRVQKQFTLQRMVDETENYLLKLITI